MAEKYVRTTGGAFWELGKDDNYHIPGYGTIVKVDDECIVARANKVHELVRVGDLVIFQDGSGKIVQEKDFPYEDWIGTKKSPFVSERWLIKEIYTQSEPYASFTLVAYKFNGEWKIK